MTILYDIINILPFSLLAVMLFGGYAGMPEDSISGYVICLLFSLWIILLRSMNQKNRLRSTGIVGVFLIGLLIAVGEENRQLFISEYFWVIHILFLSAAGLIAAVIADRNIRIKRAASAALLVYCAVGTITGQEISKEVFVLICFCLLIRTAEEIQRHWKKSGCPDIKEHITRISPAFISICLIICLIPAPDEPYDWQFAKDIWNNTVAGISRIYGFFTHISDDYGNIGFSDSGSFLAGLGENDDEVLIIEAGNTTIKNFRLVGCVSGDFTGREWVFDTGSESRYRMTDTLEMTCAVRKYAGAHQSDFMQKTDLYCESLFYNTRYIFSPAKIRLEATKEKNTGNNASISEKNGSIVTEQRLSFKDNYLVSCYVLNYGNPELAELLDTAAPIDETEWKQAAAAESVLDKPGFSFEDYRQYREEIYKKYCRSRDLPENVTEILNGIKNTSAGRYEAAKKLEKYLRELEYSTSPGALPASVTDAGSFLDWFLFTSGKGYCMHFATAFVLMANEMGIPCRYVQGYNVRRDVTGEIVVRESSAHAWPEVYFDSAGWVAFEPTPGYYVPSGWGTWDKNTGVPENEKADTDTDDSKNVQEAESKAEETKTAELDPLIFILPSLAVVAFLLLFYISGRSAARRKYGQMSPSDRLKYLTRQNLRFLGFLGFRMEEGETLSEFSDRINSSDRQDIKENTGFIPVYENAVYSDREITAEDVALTENNHRSLRELVKKSKLRFRLLLLIRKQ